MTQTPVATRGRLQRMGSDFIAALVRGEDAAAQELLAAWSDAYWGARVELDALVAQVRAMRAEGLDVSPSVLGRERRFRAVMDAARREMDRYARQAAGIVQANQEAAQAAALTDAPALIQQALNAAPPGLDLDLHSINPANLETAVGYLGDGTPLAQHLARTVAPEAVDQLRQTLTRGLTQGWDQRRMAREFAQGLSIAHSRAVTILRTETMRVYRETSRASYQANADVLESWQWQCALDRRSCIACIAQHGTRHPVTETLDGHPRCRCAMIPLTKTWAELGAPEVAETRTVLEPGETWLRAQTPATQRAIMGPLKYDAWTRGQITLEDMVARHDDPDWGTMRQERSMKAILEGRNANYGNL